MVNDKIFTGTTGWRTPSQIAQYSAKGVINAGVCYTFTNLNNMKKWDGKYAYTPTKGVNKDYRSPRLYCYGYGFDIPLDAEIKKVLIQPIRYCGTAALNKDKIFDYTLKLKTGASLTDNGIGNDIADKDSARWNTFIQGMGSYTYGDVSTDVDDLYGFYITPDVVNNQNFGCIYQCRGVSDTFLSPRIDTVRMKIDYSYVGSMSEKDKLLEPHTQSTNIYSKIVKEWIPDDTTYVKQRTQDSLSIDYNYTPFNLWIQYRNVVDIKSKIINKGYNNIIKATCTDNLRFENGKRSMTVPAHLCQEKNDDINLGRGYITEYVPLKVYPVKAGTGAVTATNLRYLDDNEVLKTSQTVSDLVVTPSFTHMDKSYAELNNCVIENCSASGNRGNSIYNLGTINTKKLKLKGTPETHSNVNMFFDYDKYRDSEFK